MLLFLAVLVYFSLTLWYNIYVERSMTCILKKEENRQGVRCSISSRNTSFHKYRLRRTTKSRDILCI